MRNSPPPFVLLLWIAVVLTVSGCASIAERIAAHLATTQIKSLDREFKIFEADLGLFRNCLKQRGGSCAGSDNTALPHSSHASAGRNVTPASSGTSQVLNDAVAGLPAGHPAKSALALLNDPVVAQTTALHDHLRGHATNDTSGFSADSSESEQGGVTSTANMTMSIGHVGHFFDGLLSSLGTTAWESLHGHCQQLVTDHGDAPGRSTLEADCRRIAFIRGYLEAYLRNGEFLEVNARLAGAINAVNTGASKINADINALLADLRTVETDIEQQADDVLKKINDDTNNVATGIQGLIQDVESDVIGGFGAAAGVVFTGLSNVAGELQTSAQSLAQLVQSGADERIPAAVSEVEAVLRNAAAGLQQLQRQVAGVDQQVVAEINAGVAKTNASLSNVFKIANVGFVSRDDSFSARLPSLEVAIDPTAAKLVTVTDEDTGERLTGASDFTSLGLATDTSGVGVGTRIGAEIVRVFLEAIFDAHEGLPAIAPANQSTMKPTALSLGAYSLPVFTSPMGNVDVRDLTRMTHTNDRVAARTRVITGRIISGIGPLNLNNPPLEDFIVEIITTTVRQATAKATWCWYACNLDVEFNTLETDAGAAATSVEDSVETLAADAQSVLKQGAEQVKLRLKLSD